MEKINSDDPGVEEPPDTDEVCPKVDDPDPDNDADLSCPESQVQQKNTDEDNMVDEPDLDNDADLSCPESQQQQRNTDKDNMARETDLDTENLFSPGSEHINNTVAPGSNISKESSPQKQNVNSSPKIMPVMSVKPIRIGKMRFKQKPKKEDMETEAETSVPEQEYTHQEEEDLNDTTADISYQESGQVEGETDPDSEQNPTKKGIDKGAEISVQEQEYTHQVKANIKGTTTHISIPEAEKVEDVTDPDSEQISVPEQVNKEPGTEPDSERNPINDDMDTTEEFSLEDIYAFLLPEEGSELNFAPRGNTEEGSCPEAINEVVVETSTDADTAMNVSLQEQEGVEDETDPDSEQDLEKEAMDAEAEISVPEQENTHQENEDQKDTTTDIFSTKAEQVEDETDPDSEQNPTKKGIDLRSDIPVSEQEYTEPGTEPDSEQNPIDDDMDTTEEFSLEDIYAFLLPEEGSELHSAPRGNTEEGICPEAINEVVVETSTDADTAMNVSLQEQEWVEDETDPDSEQISVPGQEYTCQEKEDQKDTTTDISSPEAGQVEDETNADSEQKPEKEDMDTEAEISVPEQEYTQQEKEDMTDTTTNISCQEAEQFEDETDPDSEQISVPGQEYTEEKEDHISSPEARQVQARKGGHGHRGRDIRPSQEKDMIYPAKKDTTTDIYPATDISSPDRSRTKRMRIPNRSPKRRTWTQRQRYPSQNKNIHNKRRKI
ncbi:putative surface protein SACOL0050 [Ylistrum balloti]|uniref:putative surface protein SACOL0050 n=1 Tax=Ylistrum balloti TaxID=509963 RepID=UPI0029059892|nr:putative surface protein SACOL0050 [Ylistrum balloti]